MGTYINKGSTAFQRTRRSEYIDKSALIGIVNRQIFTEQQFFCVTRCRRFGKSMAAKMLAAYYDSSCDSRNLFADLQIAADETFEEHLNKYPVIYIDMTSFFTRYRGNQDIVEKMQQDELVRWYDGYQIGRQPSMFNPNSVMQAIRRHSCESFWGKTGAFDAISDYTT